MKRLSPLFLAAFLVAALGSPGFAQLNKLATPELFCEDATGASITIRVQAGGVFGSEDPGAFAGISLHWTTLDDYNENGWGGEICELSLSGMPSINGNGSSSSRWNLGPGESQTIVIGDINFDETGVSGMTLERPGREPVEMRLVE